MNPAGSQFFEEDLLAVAETKVTTILLPKAERQSDIVDLLNALEREVEVIPQIETAKGLNELDQLLLAPCVRRVAFGHLDMAVDLGTANDWDSLVLARQTLVWRSRLHHKDPPIDSVTPAIDASEVFREAASAKRFGFGGKLLIHPKQVEPTLKAFAPSDQEVEWARKVLAALENSYGSAVAVDGKMVDKPVEDAAKRVLAALTTSEVDQSLYALIDKDKN
jgi:citrate lyase subunit beta/citryl-CoA lyase